MTPPFIYRQVKSYQVLQRQWDTNTAWVEDAHGHHRELTVAGGPYTIDDAHNVMVGDLWILAGQSNMRGFGFFDPSCTHGDGVHVFQSDEVWGHVPPSRPIHQLANSPRAIHHTLPDPTVRDPDLAIERGASLVPAFAERYRHTLGVPVGVVPCAHGGVTLGQWMNEGALYGTMLDKIRLVGGRFTGVLWYQGESDAVDLDLARQYQDAWAQWVEQLGQDTMDNRPLFVYAQVARMVTDGSPDLDLAWTLVRKAQLDVFLRKQQPRLRLAMVSTLDADMDDFIHLSAKGLQTVGQRMADAAIALIRQEEAPVLYVTTATMVDIPYSKGKRALHLLRLGFNQPAPDFLDPSPSLTAFTIHDTQTSARLDTIYSARLTLDGHLDLYLTEKGYQQLAAAPNGRYVLWYGYGRHPLPGNLVTASNVALLACGPLPIVVT